MGSMGCWRRRSRGFNMAEYVIENAKFDYALRYYVCLDPEKVAELYLHVIPRFSGFDIAYPYDTTIFDVEEIAKSCFNEGRYYLVTCECGLPDDADIYDLLNVSITENHIIWDIPIEHYKEVLQEPYHSIGKGNLKLIFDKKAYFLQVRKMLQEIYDNFKNGVKIDSLIKDDFVRDYNSADVFEEIKRDYPALEKLDLWCVYPSCEIDEEYYAKFGIGL